MALQALQYGLELFCSVGNALVHTLLEVGEGLGHCRVQHNHGSGTVGLCAHGTELEAVSGEGEGACAVAVGVVQQQFGNLGDVQAEGLFAGKVDQLVVVGLFKVVEQIGELLPEET